MRRVGVVVFLLLIPLWGNVSPALAQAQAQRAFEPQVGQAGKDVVWVPTSPELLAKMLDMAKVTPQDYVVDLGSGDGRNVIGAAKRGATAVASNTTRTWSSSPAASPAKRESLTRQPSSRATCTRPTSPQPTCSRCSCFRKTSNSCVKSS